LGKAIFTPNAAVIPSSPKIQTARPLSRPPKQPAANTKLVFLAKLLIALTSPALKAFYKTKFDLSMFLEKEPFPYLTKIQAFFSAGVEDHISLHLR
jgi:hypothetical protein